MKYSFKNKKIAIGNFDLIHYGHQKVFENADIILSFKNIPSKQDPTYSLHERKKFFSKAGKKIIFYDLKKEGNNLRAIDFYNRYLKKANKIFVGSDFVFGIDRVDISTFIKVNNINNFYVINHLDSISSTNIKKHLSIGDIQEANKFLLEPYHILSRIKVGNKLGRTIGFRTINFYFKSHKPIIPYGVYISKVKIGNKFYNSVTFWGLPKSVENQNERMETHIISFNKNIYFHKVNVYIHKKIADIKKFDNLDQLKTAIVSYIEQAKKFFKNN